MVLKKLPVFVVKVFFSTKKIKKKKNCARIKPLELPRKKAALLLLMHVCAMMSECVKSVRDFLQCEWDIIGSQ